MTDGEILAGIFLRLRKMYSEQGGANPEQVLNMTGTTPNRTNPPLKKWRWKVMVKRWPILSTRQPARW